MEKQNTISEPNGWLTVKVKGKDPLSFWVPNRLMSKMKRMFRANARSAGLKIKVFVDKKHGCPRPDQISLLKLI